MSTRKQRLEALERQAEQARLEAEEAASLKTAYEATTPEQAREVYERLMSRVEEKAGPSPFDGLSAIEASRLYQELMRQKPPRHTRKKSP